MKTKLRKYIIELLKRELEEHGLESVLAP